MKRSRYAVPVLIGLFPVISSADPVEEITEEKLPDVIVEAPRLSAVPRDFAGNSQVIGPREIEESGARSLAELLSARGGVRISSTSGNPSGGVTHLRGFGENASSRVLILVDGRPVNRPDMGAVSLLEVPLGRVERVEILRGAQTARFGDHAVGGVIHVVTKKPEKAEGYVEAAGGSDGYFLSRTGYGGRWGKQGIRLDLERNFSDGWRDNAMSEMESAALRWDGTAGALEMDAGFSWSDELVGFPGPLTGERYRANPRQSGYGDPSQYFSASTHWRGDARLRLEEEKWEWEMPLSWSRREQQWNFGAGSHSDPVMDLFSATPSFVWKTPTLDWRSGLNFRNDRLDLNQFAEIKRNRRIAKAELSREVAGVFSSLDWRWADGWSLGLAGRIERSKIRAEARHFDFWWDPEMNFSRGGNETNHAFQVGLRWEGTGGKAAWLRYDRLYRLPSTDEIASYQGYPMKMPFNDRLSAETGDQIELGFEIERAGWSGRINGFAQHLEGEIAYDYEENLNLNFADTMRYGIESEAGYQGDHWELRLRHTWLVAKYRDGYYRGKDVYLVPRQEWSALATWKPVKKIALQADYQWTGSSYEGNDFRNTQDKLPAYGVANFMASWMPENGVTVYARVGNLFDERYATVKYAGVWYPAAGRQFQVGIRKQF